MDNFAPSQSLPQSPSTPPNFGFSPPQTMAQPVVETVSSTGSKKKLIVFVVITVLLVGGAIGVFVFIKGRAGSAQKSTTQSADSQADDSRVVDSEDLANKSQTSIGGNTTENKPANYYSNQTLGFSITGPENWGKTESSNGVLVIYEDPQKFFDENNLEFHPIINVVVEPVGDRLTLDEYAKSGSSERAVLFNNYSLLGSAKETLGGEPAYIDDYTISLGSLNTRQRQVYALKGGNAYTITFSTLPKDWDSYLPTFDNVRSTFEFTGTVSGASTKNGVILGAETGFTF